jgi:hypothetical protein
VASLRAVMAAQRKVGLEYIRSVRMCLLNMAGSASPGRS